MPIRMKNRHWKEASDGRHGHNSFHLARFWLFETGHWFLNFLSVSVESFFPSFLASIEPLAALAGKVPLGAAPSSTKLLLNLAWVFSFGEGLGWAGTMMCSLHMVFSLFMELNHKWMTLLLWREAGGTKVRWYLGGSSPHTFSRKQFVLFLFCFNFKPKFYC